MITQEDKELLLKDLCSRLPYGVMCRMRHGGFETIEEDKLTAIGLFQFIEEGLECVPYLRPMSSMTKEEKAIYSNYKIVVRGLGIVFEYNLDFVTEWLLKHHFDYRGLIDKGLALEAQEGMYNN